MRIRSIRPEFWSSEDIANMDWHTRLIYIGLWSYVDDNGVGRDLERLIVSSLFPLDDALTEGSLRTHGALKHLESHGQITRYIVAGKPYLHITAWETHQKVNRPSESRYPLPTCGNAEPHDILTEPSLSPQNILSAGEGEKGRRGEEELPSASATAEREFDTFWSLYPRKKEKRNGVKAYRSARKRAAHAAILEALNRDKATTWADRKIEHIPYPASWLNGDPWDDEEDRPLKTPFPTDGTDAEKDAWAISQPLPADGAYYGGSRR